MMNNVSEDSLTPTSAKSKVNLWSDLFDCDGKKNYARAINQSRYELLKYEGYK